MSATKRRRRWVILQLVVTAVAFAVLAASTDVQRLVDTLRGAPMWGIPVACCLLVAALLLGAVRWRLVLRAYGATRLPPVRRLWALHLVGLFYNTVAAGVGGDALRGVVSREAFGGGGVAKGLSVVFIERLVGLASILVLVTGMLVIRPLPSLQLPATVAAGLLAVVLAALAGLAVARRLAPSLPALLRPTAASLPELNDRWAFGGALACSVANQAAVASLGYVMLTPLAPTVGFADALTLCPIAFAAVFVPLTVAGGGTRDAAMVALFAPLGVSSNHALAASAQIWVTYLIVSGLGGLVSMRMELGTDEAAEIASSTP